MWEITAHLRHRRPLQQETWAARRRGSSEWPKRTYGGQITKGITLSPQQAWDAHTHVRAGGHLWRQSHPQNKFRECPFTFQNDFSAHRLAIRLWWVICYSQQVFIEYWLSARLCEYNDEQVQVVLPSLGCQFSEGRRAGVDHVTYTTRCSEHYCGSKSLSMLRALETFISTHTQQHRALTVAIVCTSCFASFGFSCPGITVHLAMDFWASCGSEKENATSDSHLCLLMLIKCPSLGFSLSGETIWGQSLGSGVSTWLCLHFALSYASDLICLQLCSCSLGTLNFHKWGGGGELRVNF